MSQRQHHVGKLPWVTEQRLKRNHCSSLSLSRKSLLAPALLSVQVAVRSSSSLAPACARRSLVRLYHTGLGFEARNLVFESARSG
jgi:hypothetical protein